MSAQNLVKVSDRAYGPDVYAGEQQTIDLRGLLSTLWRRKLLLLAFVGISMALVFIVLVQLMPRYTAQALLLIESGTGDVSRPGELDRAARAEVGEGVVASEIEVLRSRGLADDVVTRLELGKDPDFNEALQASDGATAALSAENMVSQALADPGDWLAGTPEPNSASGPATPLPRIAVVDEFLDRLEVYAKGDSHVIAVDFTAGTAEKAARIANALANSYLDQQRAASLETAKRAAEWLSQRVNQLRDRVEASERAAELFRAESGLLTGARGRTLTSQEISDVNTELTEARSQYLDAKTRLRQLEALVAAGRVESVAEVLDSTVVRDLQRQLAEVQRESTAMSTEFGDQHPAMVNARVEARDLRTKIDAEIDKVVRALENQTRVAEARETAVRERLNELKGEVGAGNQEQVRVRALEREANANRVQLETFLSRLTEVRARSDIGSQQASARIISRAAAIPVPSFPKPVPILALTLIGSLFAGMLLVFVTEHLSAGDGFRSGRQLALSTGLPMLAWVPKLKGFARIGKRPERQILKRRASAFAESIRTMYTSIGLIDGKKPKTLLITSALPKEGKTTIAVCLARLHARAGHKVVVVDMDLRRPGVHQTFQVPSGPGLTDLLADKSSLKSVLRADKAVSDLHFISAGHIKLHLPEALNSNRIDELLHKLAQSYDLVVIDAPPVIPVADARILCRKVNTTVFVVRWHETQRDTVYQALNQLSTAGGRIVGIVLSMIDVKKQARSGHADAVYASRALKAYYTE